MTYVELDGVDDFIEMDSPQLSVTDLDVTVDVALDDWTPSSEEALFTDRNSGDGFTLAVHTSGGFRVYTNGTVNLTTDPSLTDGTRHTVRALYDGAAGTVEVYVDGSLHDTETGSIPASLDANPFTSLYVGSGIIGASDNAAGKFYGFTAIYDGTTEIDVDFANFDSGDTSGTATAGGTVTIDGSSVTKVLDGGTAAAVTEVPLAFPSILFGSENLFNRVAYTSVDGTEQVVENSGSQARYGIRTVSKSGLLLLNDSETLNAAERRLSRSREPTLNLDGLELEVETMDDSQAVRALSTSVGDRVEVSASPPGYLTNGTLDEVNLVDLVTHRVSVSSHSVSMRLGPNIAAAAVYDTAQYDEPDAIYGL